MPAQGRTGSSRGVHDGTGRPAAPPFERTGATGPHVQGRTISGPTASGQPPMGRSVTGGTPRPFGVQGQPPGDRNSTAASRAQGVIGGRPAPSPVSGAGGPRAPRGPVIGAAGPGTGVARGSARQRGVGGGASQSSAAEVQASRRQPGASGGVVGAPTGRMSTARGTREGFTAGGAGLVRGTAGNQQPSTPEEDGMTQEPDCAVRVEETHPRDGQQRPVPPVIG